MYNKRLKIIFAPNIDSNIMLSYNNSRQDQYCDAKHILVENSNQVVDTDPKVTGIAKIYTFYVQITQRRLLQIYKEYGFILF